MADIKVPVLPESVADATVSTWHKKVGDAVTRDENLVDIETDKVVLEVVAPADGVLEAISAETGTTVTAEQVIGQVKEGATAAAKPAEPKSEQPAQSEQKTESAPASQNASSAAQDVKAGPAVRRLLNENDIAASDVPASSSDGRLTTQDVRNFVSSGSNTPAVAPTSSGAVATVALGAREEKRVPMTRLRKRIAERLVQSQSNAAILTTFNEVDMKPIMDLRARYKERFEKTHGIKLGFMSFFTKAVTEALSRFPIVNASIDGDEIVYHGYCDIGVAVSSPRGLVVPVIRNAENLGLADIEKTIASFGQKAKEGSLSLEEMTGGTFTLSNGGVFGSLVSTPIINPPQTGILGMHKIQERPVVVDGQIVIRPMMYLALSYDHRIIDGAESVRFLVTIKELLEDPARLILDV